MAETRQTPKMGYLYPAEGEKSWYTVWEAFINQLDSDVYAGVEDPNLILAGGGTVTLDTSTDELTWTEDFELLNMLTGGVVTIAADTLAGMEAGKLAYVEISRPMTGSASKTMSVADDISGNRNYVFIVLRRGDELYFRNHADRTAMSVFDFWDTGKIITPSVASVGGTTDDSIAVGISKGSAMRLQITALGNTVDSTIQFYSDVGLTNLIYEAANKDCFSSPYTDMTSWFIGELTGGLLYYKITNDGANASVYEIEISGSGEKA